MPSSLFPNQSQGNSILAALNAVNSMGNPEAMYQHMYSTNPSFRSFADSMRGKTPEQAFMENGLDFAQVRNLMR